MGRFSKPGKNNPVINTGPGQTPESQVVLESGYKTSRYSSIVKTGNSEKDRNREKETCSGADVTTSMFFDEYILGFMTLS